MQRIGIGSKTSTGGQVLEGNENINFDGLVASSVGHQATCPACKKGGGPIVAVGQRDVWLPAGPAARAGDYIACGCPPGSNVLLPEGTVFLGAYSGGGGQFSAGMPRSELARVFTKTRTVPLTSIEAGMVGEPVSNFGQALVLAPLPEQKSPQYGAGEINTQMASSPPASGVSGAAASSAVALGRVSGSVPASFGALRHLFAVPSTYLMAFWPSDLGDSTLYTDEQLQAMSRAATRARFRFIEDEHGQMQVYGIHTSAASGMDSVPVVKARLQGSTFVAVVPGGPTLTWYPDSRDELPDASSYYPTRSGLEVSSILVRPIPEAPEVELETFPVDDGDLLDCIITFPVSSGVAPLYLVYSKPPVKLLEVDTYRGFQGRPREGAHADHMPSAAAIEHYLKSQFPELDVQDLKSMKKDVASLIVPASVHQKCSETYGGRNKPRQVEKDARDLRNAVDNNFDAIKGCLKAEGFSETEIENARHEMHQVNIEQGWYK